MKKVALSIMASFLALIAHSQSEIPSQPNEVAPLLIGEKVPNIAINALTEKSILLQDITNGKKSIVVFYRGGWCPYCNQHLSALAEIESTLLKQGFQIIAISPDSVSFLKKTAADDKLNYQLFSDSSGELTKAFGIAFKAPENYGPYLMKSSEGKNNTFLPVPSIFIVNEKSEILFEYISPNYKNRISKELLLAVTNILK